MLPTTDLLAATATYWCLLVVRGVRRCGEIGHMEGRMEVISTLLDITYFLHLTPPYKNKISTDEDLVCCYIYLW